MSHINFDSALILLQFRAQLTGQQVSPIKGKPKEKKDQVVTGFSDYYDKPMDLTRYVRVGFKGKRV